MEYGESQSSDWCPCKKGHTQTQRGEGCMMTEAEVGVTRPQAQGHLVPSEAGRGRKNRPLEPLEEPTLPTPRIWNSGLQTGRINLCCFEPMCGP